jgi:hypothetical protein
MLFVACPNKGYQPLFLVSRSWRGTRTTTDVFIKAMLCLEIKAPSALFGFVWRLMHTNAGQTNNTYGLRCSAGAEAIRAVVVAINTKLRWSYLRSGYPHSIPLWKSAAFIADSIPLVD